MITEDRLKHMLGVARKCYSIAKERKHSEDFCKKMWFIGYTHDIGYEFVESENHSTESASMLASFGCTDYNILTAVKSHSKTINTHNEIWEILTLADMQVDSQGNEVTIEERLEDIKSRYGKVSKEYKIALEVVEEIV